MKQSGNDGSMTEGLLQVRNLRKSFGGIVANDSISMDVPRGGIVGLVGPNGSGKTTLFNAIAGQYPASSGSVRFDGQEISALGAPEIARLGILRTFQQAHVYGRMSCLENLLVSAPASGSPTRDLLRVPGGEVRGRALDLLEFVGLRAYADSNAEHVSFGQRKLLEFAMALMTRPKLLLLDEPTAGVDPGFIERIIDRLARANSLMQVTLLVIEHNIGVLRELAQRIYMLERGVVVAQGAPADIHGELELAEAHHDRQR